jgi:hypothetical protein
MIKSLVLGNAVNRLLTLTAPSNKQPQLGGTGLSA